ncbi:MAG: helix-turn-helix domain-containing protein [Mesorhizobium sp.]|nr:helix-turn-helix domain-containing protein [Mesorhizobium sp.]
MSPHLLNAKYAQPVEQGLIPEAASFCASGYRPPERIAAGRTIAWEGDPNHFVFQLVEGTVRHCRLLANGRRVIADFAYPGELFGFAKAGRYRFTAEAVVTSRIRRVKISQSDSSGFVGSKAIEDILQELQLQHCAIHDRLLSLMHKNVDQRVADFILHTGRRLLSQLLDGGSFVLPMSRIDIADHLSAAEETVCRAISRLRRDCILSFDGTSAVTIVDVSQLERRAGEGTFLQSNPFTDPQPLIRLSLKANGGHA